MSLQKKNCFSFFFFHQDVAFSASTSTPTFGQSAAPGPIPFGTSGQGFNSIPFGKSYSLFFLRMNMSVFKVND